MLDSFSLDGEWDVKGKKRKIKVPSNWFLEGLDTEELTYTKKFKSQELAGKRKRLVFEGVDYETEVFLNGVRLGEHEGYFSEFSFDVQNLLIEDNFLEVRVKAKKEGFNFPWMKTQIKGILQHWDCRPGGKDSQDQGTGGIWKPVRVESFGDYRIESVKVTPNYDERTITIEPTIYCYEKQSNAKVKLKAAGQELEKEIRLKKGINKPSFTKKVDVKDWWPWDRGEQNLYEVSIELSKDGKEQDKWGDRFGMRKIVWKNDLLYVNNEKYFLRGTNYCSSQWMGGMDKTKYEKDADLLKGMNANSIRVHAHIEKKELYDVCDEKGILVWQDFPLQWDYLSWFSTAKKAKRMMKEMIEENYNHPSIFLWCCHNEPLINRVTLDGALEKTAKNADESRIVKKASTIEEHEYAGWYGVPLIDEDYKKFNMIAKNRKLVSEFGAQALPNKAMMKKMLRKTWPPNDEWKYHDYQPKYELSIPMTVEKDGVKKRVGGPGDGNSLDEMIESTQTYQAELNKFAIEAFRRRKYGKMAGIYQFMFVDCWPAITWSVLDYDRNPKKAYSAVKDAFSPVLISPEYDETPKIWVVNDLRDGFEGTMEWRLERDGKKAGCGRKKISVKGDSSEIFKDFGHMGNGKYKLDVKLTKGKEIYLNSVEFKIQT